MNQKQPNQPGQPRQEGQQNPQGKHNQQNQQGQQGGQAGQPNSPGYQSGQTDSQTGQSRQDDRFGNYGGGQGMPGQSQGGQGGQTQGGQTQNQGGQTQAGQTQGQGREVAAAGRQPGGQLARSQSSTTLLPPVDIYEDDSGFTVMADMPGVSKEQLVVRVTGDNLLIEGSASVPATANMELVYGEVQSPQYRRSFTLSRELDPGKIEAKLSNGVLRLRIPKAEQARPRRIEVNIG